jgi:hypothetical protein
MPLPGMSYRFAFVLALASATFAATAPAAADDLYGDSSRGISRIHKGVWEIDLGALGIFTHESQGDESSTRLSTDFNLTVSRFMIDNVSVGLTGIFGYQNQGDDMSALTLGGAATATAHLRLGQGAFFRPGISIGALFGNREIPTGPTMVEEASLVAFTTRISLQIAYFVSRSVALQAGPQLNVELGSYEPTGGSQSFTTIDGGFAVGVGYVF